MQVNPMNRYANHVLGDAFQVSLELIVEPLSLFMVAVLVSVAVFVGSLKGIGSDGLHCERSKALTFQITMEALRYPRHARTVVVRPSTFDLWPLVDAHRPSSEDKHARDA